MNSKDNRLRHTQVTASTLIDAASGVLQDNIGSRAGDRGDVYRGAPDITWVSLDSKNKQMTYNLGETPTVYLKGYRFYNTSNIYLSGSVPDMFVGEQVFKYFDINYTNRLKTEYPPFSGVAINQWDEFNDITITFPMPVATKIGQVDIIVQGPAGYTMASTTDYPYSDNRVNQSLITIV